MDICTLLYLKWITNKDLLCSIGNPAQCYVAAWMKKSLGENGYMYMYGWVPAVLLKLTALLISNTPLQKKKKCLYKRPIMSPTISSGPLNKDLMTLYMVFLNIFLGGAGFKDREDSQNMIG